MGSITAEARSVRDTFVTLDGERYALIENVDCLDPFFMSVPGDSDLWLFVGSNSPFTAGRRDPDTAIFPYQTVDKILRHADTSGAMTMIAVKQGGAREVWEPWRRSELPYRVTRNLYKHVLGSEVLFEETNYDLGLRLRWRLSTCDRFGVVRRCELSNLGGEPVSVEYVDGFEMLMPPGVGEQQYLTLSYLAAAYMRHESVPGAPLAVFGLNAAISDRPEPSESLRLTCAWSTGHRDPAVLLSTRQLQAFRSGRPVVAERQVRGEFGTFLVAGSTDLAPGEPFVWHAVADTDLQAADVVMLSDDIEDAAKVGCEIEAAVRADREGVRRRIAAADGLQASADERATVHHLADVLFNCMRGGAFVDSYRFPRTDVARYLRTQNAPLAARHARWLAALPEVVELDEVREAARASGDRQLIRLCGAYLPLTYSRRHGDPSRPWNRFSIRTKDERGEPVYGYEGNWRDIFQNWEALGRSYPGYLEQMIAIFLNASTADGYNPYRISRDAGVDWEVPDSRDPWGNLGYWADHQVIYLLRLLESFERVHPGELARRLNRREFSYANLPYRIAPFDDIVRDPRHTVVFDGDSNARLRARAERTGADAKLLGDEKGEVVLATLGEKLLLPALVKLGNLVPGGGIWLNAQRPEWNDANNALAGWGLSMVTVCHLRRYLAFLDGILPAGGRIAMSAAHADLLAALGDLLAAVPAPGTFGGDDASRLAFVVAAGRAGEAHRAAVYAGRLGDVGDVDIADVRGLIAAALPVLDATIRANRAPDGLYNGYNTLRLVDGRAEICPLFTMLEGQVAALDSRLLDPAEALQLLEALRASDLFTAERHSYLLYPDVALPSLIERAALPGAPPVEEPSLFVEDCHGRWYFHADLRNAADVGRRLDHVAAPEPLRRHVLDLWEDTFHHREFTGRSRSFFMFEGLGSIYWHMVAKLLVAVGEVHEGLCPAGDAPGHRTDERLCRSLAAAYDDVRDGLNFRKNAAQVGAFPTDPHSHTPAHRGAQQPGMTGLTKEEILSRWMELGVTVRDGRLAFAPHLLHRSEFSNQPGEFRYVDLDGVERCEPLPVDALGFTFCQTPVCYLGGESAWIEVRLSGGGFCRIDGRVLPEDLSQSLFERRGEIERVLVSVPAESLRP